jgi:hypothetical protein
VLRSERGDHSLQGFDFAPLGFERLQLLCVLLQHHAPLDSDAMFRPIHICARYLFPHTTSVRSLAISYLMQLRSGGQGDAKK